MRHQLAVACHPPALAPDDGTRRNDSPGTGCNNSVVDPALCLHYLHAVKAGRPWLTGGLSWPVMESTRARARGTRAPRSAPGMAQPQTPSGCGSRQDRPVACLSSCDEALLPATRWRCPEERPTPATPCRWFRRKLCGELFVFCLNKIPSKPHFFDSGEYEKRCLRKSISRRLFSSLFLLICLVSKMFTLRMIVQRMILKNY